MVSEVRVGWVEEREGLACGEDELGIGGCPVWCSYGSGGRDEGGLARGSRAWEFDPSWVVVYAWEWGQ